MPPADQILPNLPSPHERLSRPAFDNVSSHIHGLCMYEFWGKEAQMRGILLVPQLAERNYSLMWTQTHREDWNCKQKNLK